MSKSLLLPQKSKVTEMSVTSSTITGLHPNALTADVLLAFFNLINVIDSNSSSSNNNSNNNHKHSTHDIVKHVSHKVSTLIVDNTVSSGVTSKATLLNSFKESLWYLKDNRSTIRSLPTSNVIHMLKCCVTLLNDLVCVKYQSSHDSGGSTGVSTGVDDDMFASIIDILSSSIVTALSYFKKDLFINQEECLVRKSLLDVFIAFVATFLDSISDSDCIIRALVRHEKLCVAIQTMYHCIDYFSKDVLAKKRYEAFNDTCLAYSLQLLEGLLAVSVVDRRTVSSNAIACIDGLISTIGDTLKHILFNADDENCFDEYMSLQVSMMETMSSGKKRSFYSYLFDKIKATCVLMCNNTSNSSHAFGRSIGYLLLQFSDASYSASTNSRSTSDAEIDDASSQLASRKHCCRLLKFCTLLVACFAESDIPDTSKLHLSTKLHAELIASLSCALARSQISSLPQHDAIAVHSSQLKVMSRNAILSLISEDITAAVASGGKSKDNDRHIQFMLNATAKLNLIRNLSLIDHRTITDQGDSGATPAATSSLAMLFAIIEKVYECANIGNLSSSKTYKSVSDITDVAKESCQTICVSIMSLYSALRKLDDFIATITALQSCMKLLPTLLEHHTIYRKLVDYLKIVPVGQIKHIWYRVAGAADDGSDVSNGNSLKLSKLTMIQSVFLCSICNALRENLVIQQHAVPVDCMLVLFQQACNAIRDDSSSSSSSICSRMRGMTCCCALLEVASLLLPSKSTPSCLPLWTAFASVCYELFDDLDRQLTAKQVTSDATGMNKRTRSNSNVSTCSTASTSITLNSVDCSSNDAHHSYILSVSLSLSKFSSSFHACYHDSADDSPLTISKSDQFLRSVVTASLQSSNRGIFNLLLDNYFTWETIQCTSDMINLVVGHMELYLRRSVGHMDSSSVQHIKSAFIESAVLNKCLVLLTKKLLHDLYQSAGSGSGSGSGNTRKKRQKAAAATAVDVQSDGDIATVCFLLNTFSSTLINCDEFDDVIMDIFICLCTTDRTKLPSSSCKVINVISAFLCQCKGHSHKSNVSWMSLLNSSFSSDVFAQVLSSLTVYRDIKSVVTLTCMYIDSSMVSYVRCKDKNDIAIYSNLKSNIFAVIDHCLSAVTSSSSDADVARLVSTQLLQCLSNSVCSIDVSDIRNLYCVHHDSMMSDIVNKLMSYNVSACVPGHSVSYSFITETNRLLTKMHSCVYKSVGGSGDDTTTAATDSTHLLMYLNRICQTLYSQSFKEYKLQQYVEWLTAAGVYLLTTKYLHLSAGGDGSNIHRLLAKKVFNTITTAITAASSTSSACDDAISKMNSSIKTCIQALLEFLPIDQLLSLLIQLVASGKIALYRMGIVGVLLILDNYHDQYDACMYTCRVLEVAGANMPSAAALDSQIVLLHACEYGLDRLLSKYHLSAKFRRSRNKGSSSNSSNSSTGKDDNVSLKSGSLEHFVSCTIGILAMISNRVSHQSSVDTTAATAAVTSIMNCMGSLLSLSVTVPTLNNSIGVLSVVLRQSLYAILKSTDKHNAEVAAKSISNALKLVAKSINLSRHCYLFAAITIESCSYQAFKSTGIRDIIYSGLFHLFEKCHSKEKIAIASLLDGVSKTAYTDINAIYMQEWKFTGKS